ncbi:hypothetical protein [Mesorhizobium sp. M1A.F.Ca.IN.022.07.1.1]|uniref:SMa0974 family conjugal transfer regulator n=1 Tax=Mesorhizobium sp. M1A.F.Ca.IN.022.07.1.1 TaxID=2496767 RepID=UPI001FE21980|nr:hypothetical protein [Mesorhizobium sp. M1A.F.Ca.IN.022.07.1.1]
MFKHVAEAFVPLPRAEWVVEQVCAKSRDFCQSIRATAADKLLDFGDARAILRPSAEGLHVRVDAQDLATFYGVRTLLQGTLSASTTVPGAGVEWYPGGSMPFRQICRRPGQR